MKLFNKKAKFDYELTGEGAEAGIALLGIEAKALGTGRGDLSNSFIKIVGNEAFLMNANIPASGIKGYDPLRIRKLLLHKSEILSLSTKAKQQNLQFVPVKLYTKSVKSRLIKLYFELGKGKKKFQKKAGIKAHDIDRDIEREFRVKE